MIGVMGEETADLFLSGHVALSGERGESQLVVLLLTGQLVLSTSQFRSQALDLRLMLAGPLLTGQESLHPGQLRLEAGDLGPLLLALGVHPLRL